MKAHPKHKFNAIWALAAISTLVESPSDTTSSNHQLPTQTPTFKLLVSPIFTPSFATPTTPIEVLKIWTYSHMQSVLAFTDNSTNRTTTRQSQKKKLANSTIQQFEAYESTGTWMLLLGNPPIVGPSNIGGISGWTQFVAHYHKVTPKTNSLQHCPSEQTQPQTTFVASTTPGILSSMFHSHFHLCYHITPGSSSWILLTDSYVHCSCTIRATNPLATPPSPHTISANTKAWNNNSPQAWPPMSKEM